MRPALLGFLPRRSNGPVDDLLVFYAAERRGGRRALGDGNRSADRILDPPRRSASLSRLRDGDVSSTSVYYPGQTFQGHDFDDVIIFSRNSGSGSDTDRSFDQGDRLDLGYGSTCSFFTVGTCGDVVDIQIYRGTLPFPSGFCAERVDGPRGTLLVRERKPAQAWDAFTGDVALRVEGFDEQDMVDLVTAFHTAGGRSEPVGSELPLPSVTALRQIRNACR